jgi:N-acetylglucosaminyldiphosphoundecaprenol N-acetyl-beta-D-mannosaminyltransferase
LAGAVVLAALLGPVCTRAESRELAAFGGSALWVGLWGYLTDRWALPRGLRGLAVVVAAVGLHLAGLRIDVLKPPFSATFVTLGAWSLLVTMLWMWLCSALFARAGTIPGVAYGVGAVACATLISVCALRPDADRVSALWFAAAIGVVCVLRLCIQSAAGPTRPTAGAYLLGFLIGAVSIMGMLKNTAFLAAVLPLLLVSVPLFGATYAYVADLRRGPKRMALTQRREHLHWLLLGEGYSPRQITVLFTLGAAWCGALAILLVALIEVSFALKTLILVAFLALGIVGGFVLLRVLPRGTGRPGAIRLLGVRITPVSMDQALAHAREFIAEGSPHMIVTSDATGVIRAQEDPELREIMDHADLVTADGQGVVLAARLLNVPIRERVSGVDMVQRLCEVATEAGRSVFLLGGAEGVGEAAAEKLREAVPGLQIAGVQHGYFAPEEEPAIIRRIRDAAPAVLFVAFGIPKQEKWIRAHMAELGVPVCIGVGGSFDVISGRLKRAPQWMRTCGLEWLYRVAQEPWRLPRLKALPKMAWIALVAALRGETGDYVE